jgi:hypothetical protein
MSNMDFLRILQSRRGTISDRVHNIEVELKNLPATTRFTASDLQTAKTELVETEAAIEAVKVHRKCVPIMDQEFTKIIKVKDLRAILSHPADQEKKLWTFDQQGRTFDHIVGIVNGEYNGKPTINLQINVLPGDKK